MNRFATLLIPAGVYGDPDRLRRAVAVVGAQLALLAIASLLAVKSIAQGTTAIGMGILAGLVLSPLTLASIRRGWLAVAATVVSLEFWVIVNIATSFEGGIESPRWVIVPLLVLVATLLGGLRAGVVWTAICAATAVARMKLTDAGLLSEQLLTEDAMMSHRVSSIVAAAVFTVLVARVYEQSRERMLATVREQRARADQAHRDARLILDNAGQLFLTLDRNGRVRGEWSAIAEAWLGQPEAGMRFADYLSRQDPAVAAGFELAWEQVQDGFLPAALAIAQLPARFEGDGRHYSLRFEPLFESTDDEISGMVVVVSDVTAKVHHDLARARQHDLQGIVGHLFRDRAGVEEFARDATRIVASLRDLDGAELERQLHTLKGNCGLMGLTHFAGLCHTAESSLADRGNRSLGADQLAHLSREWELVQDVLDQLSGGDDDGVFLEHDTYEAFLSALIDDGTERRELHRWARLWSYEPAAMRLARLANHARGLARRLGKGDIEVDVIAADLHVDSTNLGEFWSSMVHVLRNAVDHGLASGDDGGTGGIRLELKPGRDTLWLEVADTGRGIDWRALRRVAQSRGMPHDTRQDLEDALFSVGVSTRADVTITSGRGTGMAAVKQAVVALGGVVEVDSSPERGTCFRFGLPSDRVRFGRGHTARRVT